MSNKNVPDMNLRNPKANNNKKPYSRQRKSKQNHQKHQDQEPNSVAPPSSAPIRHSDEFPKGDRDNLVAQSVQHEPKLIPENHEEIHIPVDVNNQAPELKPESIQPVNPIETSSKEPITTITIDDSDSETSSLMPTKASSEEPHNLDNEVIVIDKTDDELDEQFEMPKTVAVLTTANGAEVYLIGTAHFSLASVKDVQKVIRHIQPSTVVLELCPERRYMLEMDEQTFIENSKTLTFASIRNTIADKGLAQGLLFVMFIKISASITQELGVGPGCEFRAAYNEAKCVPNCGIVLGDRSLRCTIARAVDSLTLWQKLKLLYQIVGSDLKMTQADIEKAKQKDILDDWLTTLGVEFPGFTKVLLDERNMYLAHSIHTWASRQVAACGPQKVVAVVGIGHVDGIAKYWGKTTDDDIQKLVTMPTVSKTRMIIGKTIKYGSWTLLLYVSYRMLTPSSIQTSIGSKVSGLVSQLTAKLQTK